MNIKGFTLLEVLVATGITMFLAISIGTIFTTAVVTSTEAQETMEELRYYQDVQQVRNALLQEEFPDNISEENGNLIIGDKTVSLRNMEAEVTEEFISLDREIKILY